MQADHTQRERGDDPGGRLWNRDRSDFVITVAEIDLHRARVITIEGKAAEIGGLA